MGCYEVSLGDTIGVGTAGSVRRLLKEVLTVAPADKLALHFHDTYGQGLSNLLAGLDVSVFCNIGTYLPIFFTLPLLCPIAGQMPPLSDHVFRSVADIIIK